MIRTSRWVPHQSAPTKQSEHLQGDVHGKTPKDASGSSTQTTPLGEKPLTPTPSDAAAALPSVKAVAPQQDFGQTGAIPRTVWEKQVSQTKTCTDSSLKASRISGSPSIQTSKSPPFLMPKRGYFSSPSCSESSEPTDGPDGMDATLVDLEGKEPLLEKNRTASSSVATQSVESAVPESDETSKRHPPSAEELLKRFPASRHKHKERLFYALFVVFFVGMLYGAMFAASGEQGSRSLLPSVSATQEAALEQMQTASFAVLWMNSLRATAIFLLLLFLSGTCMIGQPFVICILFVRGLGVGSYLGYLYATYGGAGVAYTTLLLLPGLLFATIALVLAGREAMLFSNEALAWHRKPPRQRTDKAAHGKTVGGKQSQGLPLYLKKMVLLLFLLGIASLLDALLQTLFASVVTLS